MDTFLPIVTDVSFSQSQNEYPQIFSTWSGIIMFSTLLHLLKALSYMDVTELPIVTELKLPE